MTWESWMDRALELAAHPSAPRGENPRVGCVIVDERGVVVGEGWHAGAGTAHAEVVALSQAGDRSIGATAVVTLEPCNHHGRTGPCAQALIEAGIARVVFAQADPTSDAGGGARALRDAGVQVLAGIRDEEACAINREWTIAATRAWPFVTAKCAISLDGRVAGPHGQPVALTGPEASRYSHELRARVQAIVVGAQTVINDDPQLTIRNAELPVTGQPLRVVVGKRELPTNARIFDDSAPSLHIREHDPRAVLAELYERGIRHVLLEGGPTLLRAFVEAGLVDELVWLVAGVWLGGGPRALPEGERLDVHAAVVESAALGQDVLMRMIPQSRAV
ncbi:MAG: bifunctional diaminohydroxyphosphoribosylaminopyrimidine deaminase/5-amino-6-(5-phosphoribosylamino)uracil reductase RibD [Actinomycetota bacterium]|nr:bifunctional diaminohydroxyphosphoribosylaminopyrimidine deaminase/5-amino-6-(5-phosphoribosylamino)uracil reductase RibD [Actinomycetota bacterium]